jgi:perosamine synthetase
MPATAAKFLPFHQVSIEEEEIQAVVEVLRSGWLTTGPRALEFEKAFARFTGANHALAVNSGTAALHLAFAAVGISEGDEVILPTMTFAASGEAVLYFKARPVLVDCGEGTFHCDPAQIERAITSRTRAILPVHYAGCPCDMDRILDIARRHSLHVIEDAAHALPARHKNRMVGTLGDITCFSFYATKTLTTGEGGMATTGSEAYAERMRLLCLHGIRRILGRGDAAGPSWKYDIVEAGHKYNLTDIQAALGLAQLAKCDARRARRAALAARYSHALTSLDAFSPPAEPLDCQHAWHLYVVQVNRDALRISRDRVIEELRQRGVETSVHFIPLHLHTLYQNQLGYRRGQFPVAERCFERAISLPIYPAMSDEDADRVGEALRVIAREFRR